MTITITNGGRRMPHPDLAVVTGAFSYTGRYVTRRLLDQGVRVRTLTRSPDAADPFGRPGGGGPPGLLRPRWAAPLDAGSGRLLQHLLGAVRPWPDHLRPRGREHQDAVRGCKEGWRRQDSPLLGDERHHPSPALPYFRGKAQVEDMLVGLGESPTPSSGRPSSSGWETCCSTTWHGRCGASPSSPSTGAATTVSNPSTWKTLRPRRWRPALRATTPWPTLPGRTHSHSKPCFVCWPPQWASEAWFLHTPPSRGSRT